MRINLNTKTLFIFTLTLLLLSCQKDDTPPSKISFLTRKGGWRFGHSDPEPYAPGTVTLLGYYNQLYLCNVEEIYYFNSNGTVVATNTQKCNPDEPSTFSGVYTTIGLDGPSGNLTIFGKSFRVIEVSHQRLWLSTSLPATYMDGPNVVHTNVHFNIYYSPQ